MDQLVLLFPDLVHLGCLEAYNKWYHHVINALILVPLFKSSYLLSSNQAYKWRYMYFMNQWIRFIMKPPKMCTCVKCLPNNTYISLVKKMACRTPFSRSFWICFSLLRDPGSTVVTNPVINGGLLHYRNKIHVHSMSTKSQKCVTITWNQEKTISYI